MTVLTIIKVYLGMGLQGMSLKTDYPVNQGVCVDRFTMYHQFHLYLHTKKDDLSIKIFFLHVAVIDG